MGKCGQQSSHFLVEIYLSAIRNQVHSDPKFQVRQRHKHDTTTLLLALITRDDGLKSSDVQEEDRHMIAVSSMSH